MGGGAGLDAGDRLVSVSVDPGRYGEGRGMTAMAGMGPDPSPDVAPRHDEYLAMRDPPRP